MLPEFPPNRLLLLNNMKRVISPLVATAVTALIGLSAVAKAATPSIKSFTTDSVVIGETVNLSADVADTDGNLQAVVFYVKGTGISDWQTIGTVPVSGSQAVAPLTWTPAATGVFTFRADVVDPSTGSSAQRTIEVFIDRRMVVATTVDAGKNIMFTAGGELITKENTAATSVVAKPNSTLILWSNGRIVLKPGFRAEAGVTLFWAAVDHNGNGYSDLEELTDSDGDGMFDAWEIDHGLNFQLNDANGDLDGDGLSNFAEFQSGRNPQDKADALALPSGYNLVLKTPNGTSSKYYGVSTSSWEIKSSIAQPPSL
jgi:hypothetical protein